MYYKTLCVHHSASSRVSCQCWGLYAARSYPFSLIWVIIYLDNVENLLTAPSLQLLPYRFKCF
jgi:hypothetical protein